MDSLTQVVLGAAVGEAVLGRKIGNRAMLYGAIAGTIPDLDVMANLFTDEIHALAIHRGLSHSLLFAVAAPFAFAGICHQLYSKEIYRRSSFRILNTAWWMLLYGFIAFGINFVAYQVGGQLNYYFLIGSLIIGGLLL